MRWNAGIVCLLLAVFFLTISLIAYPYTTFGMEVEYIRHDMADLSIDSAIVCLVLLAIAGLLAFWKEENRHGRRATALAIALLFFRTTAIARLIYIQYFVLA